MILTPVYKKLFEGTDVYSILFYSLLIAALWGLKELPEGTEKIAFLIIVQNATEIDPSSTTRNENILSHHVSYIIKLPYLLEFQVNA